MSNTRLRFLAASFCFKGLCRPPTGQIDIVHQVEVGQVVLAGAGKEFFGGGNDSTNLFWGKNLNFEMNTFPRLINISTFTGES